MRLSIASLPTLARCAKQGAACATVEPRQQTTHTSDSLKGFLEHLTVTQGVRMEQASSCLEIPAIASSKHRDALLILQVAHWKRNSNRLMNIALKIWVGRQFHFLLRATSARSRFCPYSLAKQSRTTITSSSRYPSRVLLSWGAVPRSRAKSYLRLSGKELLCLKGKKKQEKRALATGFLAKSLRHCRGKQEPTTSSRPGRRQCTRRLAVTPLLPTDPPKAKAMAGLPGG